MSQKSITHWSLLVIMLALLLVSSTWFFKNFYYDFGGRLYPRNSHGLTYGAIDSTSDYIPDLIAAVGDNGATGYIYRDEYEVVPNTLVEGGGIVEEGPFIVYDKEGETQLDIFTVGDGTIEAQ